MTYRLEIKRELFLFFLISFTLIFIFRLDALSLPFFWDELNFFIPFAYSFNQSGLDIDERWVTLLQYHTPLYFLILGIVTKIFGWKIWIIRICSFLVGSGLMTGVYAVARLGVNSLQSGLGAVAFLLCPVMLSEVGLAQADLPMAMSAIWTLYFLLNDEAEIKLKWSPWLFMITVLCNSTVLALSPAFAFVVLSGKSNSSRIDKLRKLIKFFSPAFLGYGFWLLWYHKASGRWFDVVDLNNINNINSFYKNGPLLVLKRLIFHLPITEYFWDGRWIIFVPVLVILARNLMFNQIRKRQWALLLIMLAQWIFLSLFGTLHQRYFLFSLACSYVLAIWTFDSFFKSRVIGPMIFVLAALVGFLVWSFSPEDRYSSFHYRASYLDHVQLLKVLSRDLEGKDSEYSILANESIQQILSGPFLGYNQKETRAVSFDKMTPDEVEKWIMRQGRGKIMLTYYYYDDGFTRVYGQNGANTREKFGFTHCNLMQVKNWKGVTCLK